MPTSKKVEIPPHVQAAVDFAFGPHSRRFTATKGYQRSKPVIKLRLHNPLELKAIMSAMLPLRTYGELEVREARQHITATRHHAVILLPARDLRAFTFAWNAKKAASEV